MHVGAVAHPSLPRPRRATEGTCPPALRASCPAAAHQLATPASGTQGRSAASPARQDRADQFNQSRTGRARRTRTLGCQRPSPATSTEAHRARHRSPLTATKQSDQSRTDQPEWQHHPRVAARTFNQTANRCDFPPLSSCAPALQYVQISIALPWFLTTRAALTKCAGGQERRVKGETNGSATQNPHDSA
jgi:hypothetical protein